MLQEIPTLVLWPIFPIVFTALLAGYWFVVAAYIQSADLTGAKVMDYASDLAPGGANLSSLQLNVTAIDSKQLNQYLLLYHFFGLLWTNQVRIICALAALRR